METFTDLAAARDCHEAHGGWLLNLGWDNSTGYTYGVTDDEGLVVDLRGPEFVAHCEKAQRWDETIT